MYDLKEQGRKAHEASLKLMNISPEKKSLALLKIAEALELNKELILFENQKDLVILKQNPAKVSFADRLKLTDERIMQMAEGVRKVEQLPDPVGEVTEMVKRPNGLVIGKKRVPLGVIGIIYEARPNVTVDAAALCIKTSNACILRGGSEAINSNKILVKIMNEALKTAGFPEGSVSLVEDTSREVATEMMRMNEYINVLIPRGGAGLIKTVVNTATVPVIETGTGNCHIYIEKNADINMAKNITVNAKTSRPSVCNAAESLVIDEDIAKEVLPVIAEALLPYNVELRGCEKTLEILPEAVLATEEDFYTEYNDYKMSVKIVSGIDEAIEHINRCGTKHSEAIVTTDYSASQKFLDEIDAAAVYVNASTRFTDGFEFGFGAEIGISTQKLHARGPLGLKELTTLKYIIYGNGQVRG
ncbi:MAG: glutamate-5-semialdehyde dehydrogenase [Clostridia bacterium]|nr:glutamate-5-semialdehyde dehydrogenase [Clostridia bacterium]